MDDAELYVTNQTGTQSVIASDEVVLSQTGRVVSCEENGVSKSYTYDKVGRLTAATIGSDTYSYGFGTQDGSCANDTNDDSGMNSNRTSQTINSVTTTFCYDYADRLVSSSDPLADDVQYDAHGNITEIGSGDFPLYLYYDSSDRNWGMEEFDDNGDGVASYYSRDADNRIHYRETYDIEEWEWNMTDEKWYGFTGPSHAPSIVRNASWDVVEKYLSLPGGVLLTIRPEETGNAQKTYSLPNLHGDVMATTDASGTLTSTFQYDPFGNQVSTSLPDNTIPGASTFGWVGKHEKITETGFLLAPMQMGARVYFPTLGRFAQMDPIPGGNANDYVYPADPVNSLDLSGMLSVGVANGYSIKLTVRTYTGMQKGWGGNSLQSSPAAARALQPTVNASRIQNAATVLVQGSGRVTNARVTPAPKPKKNKSTLRRDNLKVINNGPRRTTPAPSPFSHMSNGNSFNWYKASSSANDWTQGGALAGGALGCGIGAVGAVAGVVSAPGAGPACIVFGGIGAKAGGWLGAPVGFVLGGYDLPGADWFEFLGGERLITPW